MIILISESKEKRDMKKLILVLFISISTPCYADSHESVSNFFDKYVNLNNAFDETVAWLYSDNAKIRTYQVYPKGLKKALELSGAQWKMLASLIMPVNRLDENQSQFSDITITDHGNGFKIKANRYVEAKCYTDRDYYMIVEPGSDGSLVITEEYSGTLLVSECADDEATVIAMQ